MNHTMSKREIDRLDVIKRLVRKEFNCTKASRLIGVTTHQVRTIKKNYILNGTKGLIHGSRGKPSNRTIREKKKKKIVSLLHNKYHDFGPTLATEKLFELNNIHHGPKTIRSIQIKEGLWKPRKKH